MLQETTSSPSRFTSGTPQHEGRVGKVWVIYKDRHESGSLNACRGLAYELGTDVEIITAGDIEKAGGMAGFLRQKLGTSNYDPAQWPTYTVSLGRISGGLAYELKTMAKQRGISITAIQLRNPKANHQAFDLIVRPESDPPLDGSNVMNVPCLPHLVNEQTLKKGYDIWHSQLDDFKKRPTIGVLLGGDIPVHRQYPDQGGPMDVELAHKMGRQVKQLALKEGAAVLATNSPRTSPKIWQAFMSELDGVDGYFHDMRQQQTDDPRKNPYHGILHAADRLVITSDSISMCCEAAATGKPLLVAGLDAANLREDHHMFLRAFLSQHYAEPLESGFEQGHMYGRPKPLNPAPDIAQKVRSLAQQKTPTPG
jgi:mitochondrial fission protein ELM1